MHIFIDESRSFAVSKAPNSVCCVAALIVPEPFAATLFRRFRKATRSWRRTAREVKGSGLNERQVAEVLALVRRFDVLLIADCIDMGRVSAADIERHRAGQAAALESSAARVRSPELQKSIRQLAARVGSLPHPLYVESVLLTEVVDRALRYGTLYYAQRIGSALGAFRWRIDAKDREVTEYERLWKDLVGGMMQTKSLTVPSIAMIGADYSSFRRFENVMPEPPEYLRDKLPAGERGQPFHAVDLNAVLADIKFRPSHHSTGLQLVDIAANAITRSCRSSLGKTVWEGLGRLMVQTLAEKNALRFITLRERDERGVSVPYSPVVRTCDRLCKRMVAGMRKA